MTAAAFVGETYPHRSLNVSAQRTLNMYPEIISNPDAESTYILIGTPGSQVFANLSAITQSPCRGLHYTSTSVLYVVYGSKLMRINSDGSVDATFTMSGGSTVVYMADNGTYLVMTDGQKMWLFNMNTDTLTTQNDLPFTEPVMVKFIAQRFVAFGKDSNLYWWSEIKLDGTGPLYWEGDSFNAAEGSADNIISIAVAQGELVLFGPRSYEVHRVVADNERPFSVVNGSFTNVGCGAANSPAEIMDTIFWLGSSTAGKNQVFMLKGYNAVPVSNYAINNLLGKADLSATNDLLSTTSDAMGFTYQQEGHIFYVLNLLQANKTLVYDTNGQWHERSTRDPIYNIENRWEPLWAVYAYDRILCGNSIYPNIVELSLDVYTEWDGRLIKRQRISPVYWEDTAELFHQDFVLDVETGVGLVNDQVQGWDPQVMLRFSDDSGNTWSSEYWKTLGKVGEYAVRPRWTKLGRARKRVYEITITDPVKVVITGCSMKVKKSYRR
jgi:hypothetical protein